MSSTPNPYDVLGVARDASQGAIDDARKKLVIKHHPDRQSDKSPANIQAATQKLAEVNAAYDLIKDPLKRSLFDRGISPEQRAAAFEEAIDLLFQVTHGRADLAAEFDRFIQRYGFNE